MMKHISLVMGLLLSGNALAHVSHSSNAIHSSEHLLLTGLLTAIFLYIGHKAFK